MPIRKRFLLNQKKKAKKDQRLATLAQLYKTRHRGAKARLPPNIEGLEKLVAFYYPRLSEQTRRKYAKSLYESLRKGPTEK